MSNAGPRIEFVLMCEDCREEIRGLMTFVGVYSGRIDSKLPHRIPKLAFPTKITGLEGLGGAEVTAYAELADPDGVILIEGKLPPSRMPDNASEAWFLPVFGNVRLTKAGIYTYRTGIRGDAEAEFEFKFRVCQKG